MGFPNDKKLREIRKQLEAAEPSRTLPEDPSKTQIIKYKICEKFVSYILENGITQAELARQLSMDTARLNEIVKYRIDLFTIDKLIEFAEVLDPDLKVEVA